MVWQTAWKLLLLQHSLPSSSSSSRTQQQRDKSRLAFCQEHELVERAVKQQQQVAGRAANGHSEGMSDSLTQDRHLCPVHHHQQDAAQQPQQRQLGGAAAAALGQQQQHRQQQLEQLQRLGLVSHAPARSIYDRLHTLKPARLPTRKCLQVR